MCRCRGSALARLVCRSGKARAIGVSNFQVAQLDQLLARSAVAPMADEVPEIVRIADEHDRTPFQVAIRWALQHDSVTIAKSVRPERIAENADVFSFELTADQMTVIDRLDRGARIGRDPEHFPANWA